MQKKIIALAVAGLMSGAAFAQSNVSIYGIMDVGFRHNGSHTTTGISGQNAMVSGDQSASRIGFKGTEDLGNGLKAGFTLEYGIAPDEGDTTVANMRTSVLNLSGNFGTLQMGRQLTPQNIILTAVDPFGTTGVGSLQNVYRINNRLDNLFAYVSPSFGGLTVIAGYTANGLTAEGTENKNGTLIAGTQAFTAGTPGTLGTVTANTLGDARVYALAATYANGPIFIGANYHNINVASNTAAVDDLGETVWDIAGSYDLGVAKLSGAYGKRNPKSNALQGLGGNDTKNWMLGVTAPVGPGTVLASYNRTSIDNVAATGDGKASQWAVGYAYPMSKRTNAYVKYAKVSGNTEYDNSGYGGTGAMTDKGNLGFDSASTATGYQSGLSVGLRHTF